MAKLKENSKIVKASGEELIATEPKVLSMIQENAYVHPATHPASMITGLHACATTGVAGSVAWGNVTGKPSTFPPSSHTHDYLPLSGGRLTGKLGIGINASADIHVQTNNKDMMRLRETDNTVELYVSSIAKEHLQIRGGINDNLHISAGNREVGDIFIADSGGLVGIGTTEPTEKLHVAGNVRADGFTGPGVATQAEAEAGTNNTKIMTPLRVKEAISSIAPSSHTHAWSQITDVPSATTSAKGVVQLSSAVNSTSTTLAATASAVKAAYDLANSKWAYDEATIKAVKVNSAGKADTLATARTINGTSFNGSANITTANWGTARTLTIGSTGKSVNGSGNVSWTLAEIGAAPASHTHSYLPLSGGSLVGDLNLSNHNISGVNNYYLQMPTTTGGWARGIYYRDPNGDAVAGMYFYGSGSNMSRFGINQGGYNSSDGIHIVKSSGNVGIGTSSPSYPLHVIGNVGFSGTLQAGTVPWARISGVPSASTSAKGIVQLSTSTSSTSTTLAATASAVKSVYDTTVQALDTHAETQASLSQLGHVNHAVLTTTLNTTWQGSQAPYTKTQTVSGLRATDTPIVDVVMSGTFATDQARIEAWGYVYRITTANNSITLYATEKPTVSLPIQLKVVR